jgi:hypothetical protein
MGDRGNVIVKDGDEQVCLYTHWGATELPETLRRALKRRARWNDGSYLCRIIFCEMVDINQWKEETGFGISQTLGDGHNKVITVDVKSQTVKINSKEPVSFNDFCETDIGW